MGSIFHSIYGGLAARVEIDEDASQPVVVQATHNSAVAGHRDNTRLFFRETTTDSASNCSVIPMAALCRVPIVESRDSLP